MKRKRIVYIGLLFFVPIFGVGVISFGVGKFDVRSRASESRPTIRFVSSPLAGDTRGYLVTSTVSVNRSPMVFMRLDYTFEKAKLRLISEPRVQAGDYTIVSLSTPENANESGHIVIVLGVTSTRRQGSTSPVVVQFSFSSDPYDLSSQSVLLCDSSTQMITTNGQKIAYTCAPFQIGRNGDGPSPERTSSPTPTEVRPIGLRRNVSVRAIPSSRSIELETTWEAMQNVNDYIIRYVHMETVSDRILSQAHTGQRTSHTLSIPMEQLSDGTYDIRVFGVKGSEEQLLGSRTVRVRNRVVTIQ